MYERKHFTIVCLLVFLYMHIKCMESRQFRGAVVEYGAKLSNTSKDTILLNVESYKIIVQGLIKKYKDLDIIVFPEKGLYFNESDLYAEEIPDPSFNVIPCESNSSEVLKTLSCIAKNNSIYLVINMAEKSTYNDSDTIFFYNTNVAFSRNGSLISRYRKYNVYGNDGKPFHKPQNPDFSHFDTDFGVRFGTFISFDINFKTPALDLVKKYNITHFVYTAAWLSALPYLTALQVQSAWAYSTNTVLMASGYNDPEHGSTGTGIYLGRLPVLATQSLLSLQNQVKGDFAIIAYIPDVLKNLTEYSMDNEIHYIYDTSNPVSAPLKLLKDHIDVYTTIKVNETNNYESEHGSKNMIKKSITTINKTVCDRGLCCNFVFNMTKIYCLDITTSTTGKGDEFGNYKYRLAVFNGIRPYGNNYATGGIQVCSIISCLNDDEESCAKRTDDSSQDIIIQYSLYKYKHCFTSFSNITINGNLRVNDNTFVTANILLSSNIYYPRFFFKTTEYGTIENPSNYDIIKIEDSSSINYLFKSYHDIKNPASISLYNRLYEWDGQNATVKKETTQHPTSNNARLIKVSLSLSILSFVILFYAHC